MATSSFKSTSKRGNPNSSSIPLRNANRDSDSTHNKTAPVRKRSSSVSAISRAKQSLDISTDFSNRRENPLFWASLNSIPSPTLNDARNEISAPFKTTPEENQRERDKKILLQSTTNKGSAKTTAGTDQRGRSVARNSGVKNGIGRSISRVRQRSPSRGHYGAYESEKEQEVATFTSSRNSDLKQVTYNVKNDSMVRNGTIQGCTRNSKTINGRCEATEYSEDDSACSFQISNWEDGISICSLSEAEEKTIKAVSEQMKPFQIDHWGADSSASGIYETVRSEVRRAISDIQNDLESVIRRNNVNAIATSSSAADIPHNLVDTGAVEFVKDIRREYAQKLQESEERARKLRADLSVEEHRGKELARILQEILPDAKTSNPQKSRMGRKRSTERKKISRRLTEEAKAYFDECVSISTLDSSDFSAPEDPPHGVAGPRNLVGGSLSVPGVILGNNLPMDALDNYSNNKQAVRRGHDQHISSCVDSNLKVNEPTIDQADQGGAKSRGNSQPHQFSFTQKPKENFKCDDIKSYYIKHFEREGVDESMVIADGKRSEYETGEHDLHGSVQKLFERVFFRNRIESGGLHLCAGNFTLSFSPFGSVV